MRLAMTTLVAAGLMIPPVVLAMTASTPGFAASKVTEFSSEQKKKKKTDDNTKTAPSAPPSRGQSTY